MLRQAESRTNPTQPSSTSSSVRALRAMKSRRGMSSIPSPVCGWEDDLAQLRFPRMVGSANAVSLESAQKNYADYGVAERKNRGKTRKPLEEEVRDNGWRVLDAARDNIEEPQRGVPYADSYPLTDTTVLYYWRPTYWRRLTS